MAKIKYYVRSIRWFEIAVRMGAPVVAMLIAVPALNILNGMKMLHALIAFFFGWTHGYTLNEWGGYAFDKHDPTKVKAPLLSGKISPDEMLVLSIVCAFVCIVLYALIDPRLLIIVFLSILIGVLYDHPKTSLKNIPLASYFVLFIVSINDVLLGWLIFSSDFSRGLLIGIFFGVLGLAGINYHEVGDHDSDKKTGIKTNAVRFGKRKIFIVGFIFYTVSCGYFVLLTVLKIVPVNLYLVFIISYPAYIYIFSRCLKANINTAAVHLFIRHYRIIYGVMGFFIIFLLIGFHR
jgi:4-hydroxybenzoate polyprenyltransferase